MEKIVINDLGYWSIELNTLIVNSQIDFDLYLKSGQDTILFRPKSEPFTEEHRKKLIDNGVSTLYTPQLQQAAYYRYIETHITEILNDTTTDTTFKASLVYDTSHMLVKDILANPTLGENIRRSKDMIAVSVDFILKDKNAFSNLVKVMSFDYQTYTHSVNVCTFSIALAKFIGINNEEALNNLGVGALLHDVGKTKIPEDILNKTGTLNEEEFELIKMHPIYGQEIIEKTDLVQKECYLPITQHHERDDGSGYPYALKSADIHEFSKIVAIADVFDAMTTQRSYRNAVETFPALMVMFGEKHLFDIRILEKFTNLMGPRQMVSG